jgi:hypothetical protein
MRSDLRMMRQEIVSSMATREDLVAVRTDIAALRRTTR